MIVEYLLITSTLAISVAVLLFRGLKADFLSAFVAVYAFCYAIIPLILYVDRDFFIENPVNWADKFNETPEAAPIALFISLIFLVLTLFTYLFTYSCHKSDSLSSNRFLQFIDTNVRFFGILFLFFGIASFLLYSTTVGGVSGALSNAQAIRSGHIQGEGVLTFFKHFMRLSYLGCFLIFSALLRSVYNGKSVNLHDILLFILALAVCVVVAWAYSGRANMLSFFLVFPLIGVVGKRLSFSRSIAILGVVALAFLVIAYMRPLIMSFGGAEQIGEFGLKFYSIIDKVISAFTVPYVSLQVVISEVELSDVYFGKGFILAFFEIIPQKLFGLSNSYTINTAHTELYGYVVDERQYTITAGLISYFFYDFWYLGIIIGAIFSGVLLRFSQMLLLNRKASAFLFIFVTYCMIKMPAYFINSDPASIIKGEFPYMVALAFMYIWYLSLKSAKKLRK